MHNILYSQLWLDLTGRYARVITNGMDVKEADRQLLIPIGGYREPWANHSKKTEIRMGGIPWYIWAPYPGEMDMHGMETPVILAGRYENHFYIVYADILRLKNLLRAIDLHGPAFYVKLPKVYEEPKKSFLGDVYSLQCFVEGVYWDRICKEMAPWNVIAFGTPWLEKYCWNVADRQLMWIRGKELDELEWLGYCAVAGWFEKDNGTVLPGIYQLVDICGYEYVGQCVMPIEAYTPKAFLQMYCKTHKNYLGRQNKQDYLFLESSEDGLNFMMIHVMHLDDDRLAEWVRRAGCSPTQELVNAVRQRYLKESHIFISTMYTSKVKYFCNRNAVIESLISQNRKGAGITIEDIRAAIAAAPPASGEECAVGQCLVGSSERPTR